MIFVKKTLTEIKKANSALRHVRTDLRSMVSEGRLNSFMTDVLIIKNQSINMQSKSMDWFLYDRDHPHERIYALLLVCIRREIYSLIMRHLCIQISKENAFN